MVFFGSCGLFTTNSLVNLMKDSELLLKIVEWQRELLEYNAVYSAFLLGKMDEVEFKKEVSRFVKQVTPRPRHYIIFMRNYMRRITGVEYCNSDLAHFLQCPVSSVEEAIEWDKQE